MAKTPWVPSGPELTRMTQVRCFTTDRQGSSGRRNVTCADISNSTCDAQYVAGMVMWYCPVLPCTMQPQSGAAVHTTLWNSRGSSSPATCSVPWNVRWELCASRQFWKSPRRVPPLAMMGSGRTYTVTVALCSRSAPPLGTDTESSRRAAIRWGPSSAADNLRHTVSDCAGARLCDACRLPLYRTSNRLWFAVTVTLRGLESRFRTSYRHSHSVSPSS
mmetsp:Transcript_71215/g.119101  ORF Transcript_71215/g.119101 Transcript_71215/m.119101 type:complete len:218 (-) Transcript_71215:367-1020(-)